MPKVSIIIPTYDRSFYIKDAVNSVLEQSYKDYELIVVDDGSSDNTKTTLQRFSKSIKYIYQEHKGVSAARNTGIASAAGEYITFLDSDDLWTANKLKEQTAFMDNNPEALICYTDEIWIRRGRRVNPMKKHAKFSGWIFEKCLPLCIVSPSSVLMRRELFDRAGLFDDKLLVCEDYDLWLRVSLAYPIFLIEKRLIVKRGGHSDQLSGKMWGNDRYRIIALEKILKNPNLTIFQKRLVLQQLVRKCAILYNGYRKREKKEASVYKRKMEEYEYVYPGKLHIRSHT